MRLVGLEEEVLDKLLVTERGNASACRVQGAHLVVLDYAAVLKHRGHCSKHKRALQTAIVSLCQLPSAVALALQFLPRLGPVHLCTHTHTHTHTTLCPRYAFAPCRCITRDVLCSAHAHTHCARRGRSTRSPRLLGTHTHTLLSALAVRLEAP